MLKQLQFINTAVDPKSSNDVYKNLIFENGHVRATNGRLSMGAPIETDLKCLPNADLLLKAVKNCKDVISLSETGGGRLSVKSGKFRALIPCFYEDLGVHPKPSGRLTEIDGQRLYDTFETLQSFVSTDGLRPWANSIRLHGQSAFATNNFCFIESWLGVDVPTVCIPLSAVKAVLKQSDVPDRIYADHSSVTFMYPDDRWIKTQLHEDLWPDISGIINVASNPQPLPESFFDGLDAVSSFSDRVYFRDGHMCSSRSDADGAAYEVDGLPATGLFQVDLLKLLKGVATSIDLTLYPENIPFYGENIRGLVMSLR